MVSRLSVRKRFVGLSEKDNSPTPTWFYNFIVNELGFIDVCRDPNEFNFMVDPLPEKSYCNPPFSEKSKFVKRACKEAKKGKLVVMLLPADISTQWFVEAHFRCNASVVLVAGGKVHSKRALFPSMLLIFNGRREVHIVHINQLRQFLKNYLLNDKP